MPTSAEIPKRIADLKRLLIVDDDDEARALLTAFRFPFRQEQQVKPQEQQKG